MISQNRSLSIAHEAIGAFWEHESREYDRRDGHGIFSDAERDLWKTSLSAIPPDALVLDIATGTGFVAHLLAEMGHRVTGVDASAAMLAEARTKTGDRGFDITFEHGATERLPFGDASFDAVTARHLTWTLLEPEQAFNEWHRVLVPGGTMITDCSLNPRVAAHHYTEDIVAVLPFGDVTEPTPVVDVLRAAGFTDVDIVIVGEHGRAMLRARAGGVD